MSQFVRYLSSTLLLGEAIPQWRSSAWRQHECLGPVHRREQLPILNSSRWRKRLLLQNRRTTKEMTYLISAIYHLMYNLTVSKFVREDSGRCYSILIYVMGDKWMNLPKQPHRNYREQSSPISTPTRRKRSTVRRNQIQSSAKESYRTSPKCETGRILGVCQ